MSDQAIEYFNRAQGILLPLHASISENLTAQAALMGARSRNEASLSLVESEEYGEACRRRNSPEIDRLRMKLDANLNGVETYEQLIVIAAGGILQIAKQALSIRFGDLKNAASGRQISCTCVRDLIWQGRNQAMHYEETRPASTKGHRPSTWVVLFEKLHREDPQRFDMSPPYRSLAKDVIDLLGWTHSYSTLESDLRDLLSHQS